MRSTVFAFAVCVAFVAVIAVPSPGVQNHFNGKIHERHQGAISGPYSKKNQIKNVILLRRLSNLRTRDFISDLIEELLNMTPTELLIEINNTFLKVDKSTKGGAAELNKLTSKTEEIKKIMESTINKMIERFKELLRDFSILQPVLTSSKHATHDFLSDAMYSLINKTLEQFLRWVAETFEFSLKLSQETRAALRLLGDNSPADVRNLLNQISENYFVANELAITPINDKLKIVLEPFRIKIHSMSMGATPTRLQYRDLLDAAVSSIMGFNIELAAVQADVTLLELTQILESTREELIDALALSGEVQTKVMDVYDSGINQAFHDMQPIFKTLLLFHGDARNEPTFAYNLLISLFGIGKGSFKTYVRTATKRIDTAVRSGRDEIFFTSMKGGINAGFRVWGILRKRLQTAAEICKPLLEVVDPILGDDDEDLDFENSADRWGSSIEEEEWLDSDESVYNRGALISSVSNEVGFRISKATLILKSSLENLDDLMESAVHELDEILIDNNDDIHSDIIRIMNQTLDNIQRTLQPMMDVLLPFLPSRTRGNRDTALEIFKALNGVGVEHFLDYSSSIGKKISEITSTASHQLYEISLRGELQIQEEIQLLLQMTEERIQIIIKPFVDIIGPIISPL